ncbi:MAG: hypothetical protein KKI08_19700 [Armatimonadetes bacterium]|nr:hypothetical protein [Armatimonadota bacterium]
MRTVCRLLPVPGVLLFCVLTVSGAQAAPDAATPRNVTVGIYLVHIYDVDPEMCTYTADFYIWFRWHGEDQFVPRRFVVMNGALECKEDEDLRRAEGLNFVSYHCRALLHGDFDFAAYPWDSQELTIEIEDDYNDINDLVYIADHQNTTADPSVTVGNWRSGQVHCYAQPVEYNTNYGNPWRPPGQKATYSRFHVVLPLRHEGLGSLGQLFIALFVSVAIAFLSFLISASDFGARASMGVAAVFGVVSSHILLRSGLPDAAGTTVADRFHHVALGFIFLALLQSCITARLCAAGRDALCRRLDLWSLVVFPLVFVILLLLLALPVYQ